MSLNDRLSCRASCSILLTCTRLRKVAPKLSPGGRGTRAVVHKSMRQRDLRGLRS